MSARAFLFALSRARRFREAAQSVTPFLTRMLFAHIHPKWPDSEHLAAALGNWNGTVALSMV
jgi:hypothetical protein